MDTFRIYKEEELLKTVNGEYIVEAYKCRRVGDTIISLCVNSSPMFCRTQKNVPKGDYSWMEILKPTSSILAHDNIEERYNTICPKVAWGMTAYLLFYSDKDDQGDIYFEINDEAVTEQFLFDSYFSLNENKYKTDNKKRHKSCISRKKTHEFDKEFIEHHISQEESLINKQNTSIPDYIKEKAKEYIEWCIYKKENLDNAKAPSLKEDIKQATPNSQSFRNIIQHKDPEMFLKRLHALIDGRSGADVGGILLKAKQENYITRNPTKKEYESEFELIGCWTAITNYLDENNENALERANKIVFF